MAVEIPLTVATPHPHWEQLLELQGGVLARRQALRGRMTAATWDWKVAHHWQLVLPGSRSRIAGP